MIEFRIELLFWLIQEILKKTFEWVTCLSKLISDLAGYIKKGLLLWLEPFQLYFPPELPPNMEANEKRYLSLVYRNHILLRGPDDRKRKADI